MNDVRLVPAGDAALVAQLGAGLSVALNARAVGLADALRAERLPGVRDVVPTLASVTVYFDPLATDLPRLESRVRALASEGSAAPSRVSRRIDVPVCYGGDFGPDLGEVARHAGCSEDEVVALHAGGIYRVFMLGFVPGFAYLGVVDRRLAVPRRREPRTRVATGSVALAGGLTGIYPAATPGGWQVIGRTPLQTFVPDRAEPCLLAPGDEVRFYQVDRDSFERAVAGRGHSS